jgi:NAD(P)-dependent dehydrogenase (short-subunit alcohol dehydrogenase family)
MADGKKAGEAPMITIGALMDLKGRAALVTGAAGAIGTVIAHGLAELGADLVLADRAEASLDGLVRALRARWSVEVHGIVCDLESEGDRVRLVEEAQSRHDRLAIVVNNAAFVGTSTLQGWAVPFEEQSVRTWRRAMEVNLTAPFHICQMLAPELRRCKGASIINIGSIYGQYGPDWALYEGTSMSNPAAYGASKGGLIQLTRWLATTLAPDIRVNAVSPGGVFRNQPESFVARYECATPLARMATETDMVGAVAYLASDLSSYVTGQNICVDGGWGVW